MMDVSTFYKSYFTLFFFNILLYCFISRKVSVSYAYGLMAAPWKQCGENGLNGNGSGEKAKCTMGNYNNQRSKAQ